MYQIPLCHHPWTCRYVFGKTQLALSGAAFGAHTWYGPALAAFAGARFKISPTKIVGKPFPCGFLPAASWNLFRDLINPHIRTGRQHECRLMNTQGYEARMPSDADLRDSTESSRLLVTAPWHSCLGSARLVTEARSSRTS